MQDLVQDLASLARKIVARFAYFMQYGFYWDIPYVGVCLAYHCFLSSVLFSGSVFASSSLEIHYHKGYEDNNDYF